MTTALSESDLDAALSKLPGWGGDIHGLTRQYRFSDFRAAMAFMQHAADSIEARQHHPEWTNVYNTLTIRLRTHDAEDRVTAKDLDLAHCLDDHFAAYSQTP